MELNLTKKQKLVLWFIGLWFVLMIISAFARADQSWGHTMLYLSSSCLTMAVMVSIPVNMIYRIFIGVLVLIASVWVTVLVSVTVQSAIANIDPLEVWATGAHHTEMLFSTFFWEIPAGICLWWQTGSPDAFRTAGCQGHHLFLALFFIIVFGVWLMRGIAQSNRMPAQ